MREQNIHKKFLESYDECADEVFVYCFEHTGNRDTAKFLTRTIFRETWDDIIAGSDASDICKRVRRNAKEIVRQHLSERKEKISIANNLWNLTLSQ